MKRAPFYILTLALGVAIGVLACLLFIRFLPNNASGGTAPDSYMMNESEGVTQDMLVDMALEAAGYLKTGNFDTLSQMVHPTYGVIFSPYATVDVDRNQRFSAKDLKKLSSSTETYVWGGALSDNREPISLTVSQYFQQYVADRDYTAAPLVGINYIVRMGNALENVTSVFPGAQFVDLCYPGTAENENADWSILRLVFEEYNGEWKLTAVIHSEAII